MTLGAHAEQIDQLEVVVEVAVDVARVRHPVRRHDETLLCGASLLLLVQLHDMCEAVGVAVVLVRGRGRRCCRPDRRRAPSSALLTTRYSLLTTRYSPLTAYYPPLTTHHSPLTRCARCAPSRPSRRTTPRTSPSRSRSCSPRVRRANQPCPCCRR